MNSYFNNPLYNNLLVYPKVSTLIERVSSIKDIENTPITTLNSEDVYFNKDDDTVLYISRVDSNGARTIKRYRYYEDPEPTQQQINDSRYVTIEEFNKLKDEILSSINNKNGKGKTNGSKPTYENVRDNKNIFEPKSHA